MKTKDSPVKRVEMVLDDKTVTLKQLIKQMEWLNKLGFETWIERSREFKLIFEKRR